MSLNALKIVKYEIITAVLLQHVSLFQRKYRDLRSHPRGVTMRPVPITAECLRLPRYYHDPIPVQLSRMVRAGVKVRVPNPNPIPQSGQTHRSVNLGLLLEGCRH